MKIKTDKSKLIIIAEVDLANRDNVRDELIRFKWLWLLLNRVWEGLEP